MIELVRIDTERNLYRYYSVRVEPDLFAAAVVIRQWGRIGAQGAGGFRVEPFASEEDADATAERYVRAKLRRGYVRS